jgi:hypothetical protein
MVRPASLPLSVSGANLFVLAKSGLKETSCVENQVADAVILH